MMRLFLLADSNNVPFEFKLSVVTESKWAVNEWTHLPLNESQNRIWRSSWALIINERWGWEMTEFTEYTFASWEVSLTSEIINKWIHCLHNNKYNAFQLNSCNTVSNKVF